jgi:hypothetical protein
MDEKSWKSIVSKPRMPFTPPPPSVTRIVKSGYHGIKHVPTDLNSAGLQVLLLLCRCYQVGKDVREAPILEVIWGLSQGGYPPNFIMAGIQDLHAKGYVALTDSACHVLDLSTVRDTSKVWYMLTDKWLALLALPDNPGLFPEVVYGDVKVD